MSDRHAHPTSDMSETHSDSAERVEDSTQTTDVETDKEDDEDTMLTTHAYPPGNEIPSREDVKEALVGDDELFYYIDDGTQIKVAQREEGMHPATVNHNSLKYLTEMGYDVMRANENGVGLKYNGYE